MCADRDKHQRDEDSEPPEPSSARDVQASENSRLHGDRTGSALGGRLDYADLAERVVQGITVTQEEKKDTQD